MHTRLGCSIKVALRPVCAQGGVKKEFFQLLVREIFNEARMLLHSAACLLLCGLRDVCCCFEAYRRCSC